MDQPKLLRDIAVQVRLIRRGDRPIDFRFDPTCSSRRLLRVVRVYDEGVDD
jgi:hypothetical protein